MTLEEQIDWMKELSLINPQFAQIVSALEMLNFHIQAYPVVIYECGLYKRAFELACGELQHHIDVGCECEPISNFGVDGIKEYFLREAGENNDKL